MAEQRRILITGSTRGIGLAIAERFAASGDEVLLNYAHNKEQALDALAKIRRTSRGTSLIRADVTFESDVISLVTQATSSAPIDVWINNVGPFLYKPYSGVTVDEWQSTLDANLLSVFLCCREILPSMRKVERGVILNLATMAAGAIRPTPNTLPYAIAKMGVVMLTKTLAKEEARHGIRINAIAPGFVEGGDYPPEDIQATIPLGRLVRSVEVSAAAHFLASEDAASITGAVLDVNGGALL